MPQRLRKVHHIREPEAARVSIWDALRENQLEWLPELGFGWYLVQSEPYGDAYWQRYRGYDCTLIGTALTAMRMGLVNEFWDGPVVDIGIGGGRFVAERPNTRGYDVNPYAVSWLFEQGAWCDPYTTMVDAITCWDSLEHIADPAPLLANVRRLVFVSIPIFDGPEHVMRSKHFRRDEHFWHFTAPGLQRFMGWFGFELIHADQREQAAGREDIGSFVFARVGER